MQCHAPRVPYRAPMQAEVTPTGDTAGDSGKCAAGETRPQLPGKGALLIPRRGQLRVSGDRAPLQLSSKHRAPGRCWVELLGSNGQLQGWVGAVTHPPCAVKAEAGSTSVTARAAQRGKAGLSASW